MTQNAIDNAASSLDVDNININTNTISSTDTNGNIIMSPDGTGTISVTAAPIVPTTDRADSLGSATNSWDNLYADGISFDDGTSVLGAYTDITTWTPTLAFGGSSTGITYHANTNGKYIRLGNIVYIVFELRLTNDGSATGAATIGGLPVTSDSTSPTVESIFLRPSNTNLSSGDVLAGQVGSASTTMALSYYNAGTETAMIETDFTNTTIIRASGIYFV